MSLAGSIKLAELERWLRTIGAQQTSTEDALIVELARRLAPARWSPRPQAVSEPGPRDTKPMQPLEMTMVRPSIEEEPDDPSETSTVEVEASQASDFDDPYSRGSEGWKLKVSALALGGVVIIGALFDLARAPPGNMSPPGAFAPPAASAAQPPSGLSGGTPVVATVDTSILAALVAAPAPTASQFPDPKAVPSISLRPDGTPIATWSPSATDSGIVAHTSNAAKLAANPPPEAASETGGIAQPSTPKLDLPKKRSGKYTLRVVVASADTTARATPTETLVQPEAPVKPEEATRAAPEAARAAAKPQAAPPAPAASAQQVVNPVARAFGERVDALAVSAETAQQRVDPTAATDQRCLDPDPQEAGLCLCWSAIGRTLAGFSLLAASPQGLRQRLCQEEGRLDIEVHDLVPALLGKGIKLGSQAAPALLTRISSLGSRSQYAPARSFAPPTRTPNSRCHSCETSCRNRRATHMQSARLCG